jgi:transcriptional regulator of heat shock response
MLIVRVFDQLIYNMDRNLGNIVIDKDWKIWMIDHTRAFRMWKQIKDKKDLEKCDRQLLARLRQLDLQELHRRLDPHLNKAQVDALKARADLIVKFFDDAVKKRGESKVLYDYLPAS